MVQQMIKRSKYKEMLQKVQHSSHKHQSFAVQEANYSTPRDKFPFHIPNKLIPLPGFIRRGATGLTFVPYLDYYKVVDPSLGMRL